METKSYKYTPNLLLTSLASIITFIVTIIVFKNILDHAPYTYNGRDIPPDQAIYINWTLFLIIGSAFLFSTALLVEKFLIGPHQLLMTETEITIPKMLFRKPETIKLSDINDIIEKMNKGRTYTLSIKTKWQSAKIISNYLEPDRYSEIRSIIIDKCKGNLPSKNPLISALTGRI